MKILILGGTKFFGKILVQRLVADGDSVTLVSRGNNQVPCQDQLTHIKCDRADQESLAQLLGDQHWDIVYDQICYDGAEARQAVELFEGRTKRYVFTSSASVYGPGSLINEAAFDAPGFAPNPDDENQYRQGKCAAEQVFDAGDLNNINVRFPIVMGQRDTTARLTFHLRRMAENQDIYAPNWSAKMTYIEEQDAANFLHWVGKESTFSGPLNACSEDPISLEDLTQLIARHLNKPCNRASEATTENHSPYGVSADWTLSNKQAQSLGYQFNQLPQWLPSLVAKEVENLKN